MELRRRKTRRQTLLLPLQPVLRVAASSTVADQARRASASVASASVIRCTRESELRTHLSLRADHDLDHLLPRATSLAPLLPLLRLLSPLLRLRVDVKTFLARRLVRIDTVRAERRKPERLAGVGVADVRTQSRVAQDFLARPVRVLKVRPVEVDAPTFRSRILLDDRLPVTDSVARFLVLGKVAGALDAHDRRCSGRHELVERDAIDGHAGADVGFVDVRGGGEGVARRRKPGNKLQDVPLVFVTRQSTRRLTGFDRALLTRPEAG